jgi:hypothetical protein
VRHGLRRTFELATGSVLFQNAHFPVALEVRAPHHRRIVNALLPQLAHQLSVVIISSCMLRRIIRPFLISSSGDGRVSRRSHGTRCPTQSSAKSSDTMVNTSSAPKAARSPPQEEAHDDEQQEIDDRASNHDFEDRQLRNEQRPPIDFRDQLHASDDSIFED